MCGLFDKVEYLSQMLANNAVELHRLSAPDCTTIAAYQCPHDPEHWHIGHDGLTAQARELRATCKAQHPFTAPFRRRMHRRSPWKDAS